MGAAPAMAPARAEETDSTFERRETSGVTTRLILSYVDRELGRGGVEELLRIAGLEGREERLRDENQWSSWETKIALLDAAAVVLGDPQAGRKIGAAGLDFNLAQGVKLSLRALGTPRLHLQQHRQGVEQVHALPPDGGRRGRVAPRAHPLRRHLRARLRACRTASSTSATCRARPRCSVSRPRACRIRSARATAATPASTTCAGRAARHAPAAGSRRSPRPPGWPAPRSLSHQDSSP